MIHGPYNIKLITAQQRKIIHLCENIKIKLYKRIAAIWYNKTRYQSLRIQLVQNAPDDGRMNSETVELTYVMNKLNH